jgi:hypothetical protein
MRLRDALHAAGALTNRGEALAAQARVHQLTLLRFFERPRYLAALPAFE